MNYRIECPCQNGQIETERQKKVRNFSNQQEWFVNLSKCRDLRSSARLARLDNLKVDFHFHRAKESREVLIC